MGKINIGKHSTSNAQISLKLSSLTKHTAITAMTGTGKTGAIVGMIEGFVEQGIPSIVIDIKGDLLNVAQQEGILKDRMALTVLTPGANHGEMVDIFAGMERPERVQNAATSLLKMIKEKNTDAMSPKHAFLSHILHYMDSRQQECDLAALVEYVQEPPFECLGNMFVDDVIPSRTRNALAAKLNGLIAAPSMAAWREGQMLDAHSFTTTEDGRTPVVVYSVAHLVDEEQRLFAVSLLLDEMLYWMRKQPGTDTLRCSLIIDECAGLLPPNQKPSTKIPIMTMLKQGRAFGLGLVLSSQNPMDLDYKAMSNCETWMVGRLQMANDKRRVLDAICSSKAQSRAVLSDRISRLTPRKFLLVTSGTCLDFNTREVSAKLSGPMTPNEIKDLVDSLAVEEEGVFI